MTEFRYDPGRARVRGRDYQVDCEARIANALAAEKPTLLHVATGGGKTFVANNAVANALSGGGYALWVAKDWWLLRQAALDMASRHQGLAGDLRRLGGDEEAIRDLPEADGEDRGRVVYTTLQTFKRRLDDGDLDQGAPQLVVWDECHWGYAGKTGKALLAWAADVAVPVLGLTGTPKNPDAFTLACRHTFKDLMESGYLARPVTLPPRRTGVRWEPRKWNKDSDFTDASLRELSTNRRRNRQIVQEYCDNADRYGKTLMFACNIEHAELLAQLLAEAGVDARPVHSRRTREENERAVSQFESVPPEVSVLVNVAKMTTGVDIPDIWTIFLCRPTASDILFAQMVGRGARRTEGKESFNIVEFTDNVVRFEHVWNASSFFGTEAGTGQHDVLGAAGLAPQV